MSALRKNILLGTAGHVDHGKTALVKVLTGCETDTLTEEKQRGLTIELGFAPCRMADERIVGIVDVPGHVNFIRNMVAGAHGLDVVIFVVAADDGVMPQTREHLDILTLMGVRRGLVALTKIDLVDAARRQAVTEEVGRFVQGTFLADAAICGVSNVTGEGYDALLVAMNEAVAASQPRPIGGLFRMWVERAFSIRGFGTVASGVPTGGRVGAGDALEVLPGGEGVRVRQLEVYGESADEGRAGECVALNLADADADALDRGRVICAASACRAVAMVEAELTMLPSAAKPLADYAEVHMHVGTAEVMGHVALLAGDPIGPGASAMVQLRLAHAAPIAPGDRFVIRAPWGDGGLMTTVGGGRILAASDRRLRRNRPWTLAALQARRESIDDPASWCATLLAEADTPTRAEDLAAAAAMPADQVAGILADLAQAGTAVRVDGRWIYEHTLANAAEDLRASLEAFCQANPSRAGAEPDELTEAAPLDTSLRQAAIEHLIDERVIERQGRVLVPAGRHADLSAADRALCERLAERLRAAQLEPPLPADLAKELRVSPAKLAEIARVLADRRQAATLDEKVIMHREAIAAARTVVMRLFAEAPGFTTMAFRDALGVSRKYAVPLLDYFDTIKLTVRRGNRRTPGAAARDD